MILNAAKKILLAGGSPRGQVAFTTPGTYNWTVPAGVRSVCVVGIGAGANIYNGAGSLAWGNDIPVTPGEVIQIQVGAPGGGTTASAIASRASWFRSASFLRAPGGSGQRDVQSPAPDGSARQGGGRGGSNNGGAGGYTGNGGNGARTGNVSGTDGTGGGGGGGGHFVDGDTYITPGGGVGILGAGPSGTGSRYAGGRGGSGGANGLLGNSSTDGGGGLYGGAGGGADTNYNATRAGGGAVRVLWGSNRAFPATNTGDVA